MNIEHVCGRCLYDKGTCSECPKCGWREGTQSESPLHLPPRTLLNKRYLIGRVLGHGGFGITYLARDISLKNKFVAVKEYLPRDVATRMSNQLTVSSYSDELKDSFREGMEKFYEEANSLTQFDDHPGIVSVRDYFKENGTAYMVMPFLEGCTFKQYLLQQGGKVSYTAALSVMLPVMDALREVHSKGILHRDISPDNIYITKSKQIKILDFGAARYAAGEHSKSLSVILKAGFAPEEQYRSGGNQGPWTDVYAVGATLYRAITGKALPEALDRIVEDTLEPPSKLGVDIPPNAERALMKALSVRAPGRFKTIKEFQDALIGNKCLSPSRQPVNDRRSTETIAVSAAPPKKAQQNSVLIALIAVFFVIGAAILTYYIFGVRQGEEMAGSEPAVSETVVKEPAVSEPAVEEEPVVTYNPATEAGRWPFTSVRRVTLGDLSGKSAQELDIMRNEIYARHGWVFLQPGLRRYFNEQPWYQPMPVITNREDANNQVVSRMSSLEIQNAVFILNYQKEHNLLYYK